MDFIKEPMAIENRSMELIAPHLAELHLDERATKLYSRLIHASGDVGYAPITRVHPEAIDRAIEALKAAGYTGQLLNLEGGMRAWVSSKP